VIPLEEKIERRQLSGHITKMDDNRKVKAMPKAGSDKKRKRRRPTRTWNSIIRKLLKQREKENGEKWKC
jgi:hypothetical protein